MPSKTHQQMSAALLLRCVYREIINKFWIHYCKLQIESALTTIMLNLFNDKVLTTNLKHMYLQFLF